MWFKLFLVFVGGGMGSVARFLLGYLFAWQKLNGIFATLTANVISCIIIALVMAESFSTKNNMTQTFWAIGICGGLSTFSTFSWQNWQLIQNHNCGMLVFNICSNLLLTFLAIWIGLKFSAA